MSEFEASPIYTLSFRAARTTKNSISNKRRINNRRMRMRRSCLIKCRHILSQKQYNIQSSLPA